MRAVRLEQALQTPAHIYFKYEGVSPAGSHKPNTAIAQAYYNKEAGIRRLSTETGRRPVGLGAVDGVPVLRPRVPGLHGQGLVRAEAVPADVHGDVRRDGRTPRPAPTTQAGSKILERHPDSTGSLGIAISEAVEVAATNDDTNYSLGSVLSHVLLHQTVIGLETKKQMEMAGEYARLRDRLRRRRLELRRVRVPVHGRQAAREARRAVRRDASRRRARR